MELKVYMCFCVAVFHVYAISFSNAQVCEDGMYGESCTMTCGNCVDDEPCNKSTGVCPSGCAAGWEGSMCTVVITTQPQTTQSTSVSLVTTGTSAGSGTTSGNSTQTTVANGSERRGYTSIHLLIMAILVVGSAH